VILIAGGYDKKIPFEELGEEICRHVKTVVLNGHTAGKIQAAIVAAPSYEEGQPEIIMAADFQDAVLHAQERAEPGDVVILSPACASFDQFPNFAERGRAFKQLVNNL
jgi:UDP-N-acetylmuramoylalanine--D-glutamate ligase